MFGLNLLHLATFDPQQARSGHRFLAGFGIRTAGQEGPSIALLWLVARRFAPKFLLHALVGSGSASIGGYDAGARPGQHQLRHLLVQGKRSLTPPGSPHRGALPGPLMAKATMGRLKCCPLGSNAINLEARGLDTNLAAVRGGDGGQENENSPRQRQQPRAERAGLRQAGSHRSDQIRSDHDFELAHNDWPSLKQAGQVGNGKFPGHKSDRIRSRHDFGLAHNDLPSLKQGGQAGNGKFPGHICDRIRSRHDFGLAHNS